MIKVTDEIILQKLEFMYESHLETTEEATEFLEGIAESDLQPVLDALGIRNSIKDERKSLPPQNTVTRRKYFTSFGNDATDVSVLYRMFIRDLLEKGFGKIRYYVDVKIVRDGDGAAYGFDYTIVWYGHEFN